MAIIPVPAILAFTNVGKLRLRRATNLLRSRYTGQAQKISYPYAIWTFEGTLREYYGLDAGIIRSFLVQLEGQKNECRLLVPGYSKSLTGFTATLPTLGAVVARATSVTVSGGPANVAYLNDGDYITIQDELKMVVGNIAFNGAGQAVINFKPSLRKAVAAGVGVIVNNPTCLMQAADDDVASWGIAPPVRQSGELSLIEAVGI